MMLMAAPELLGMLASVELGALADLLAVTLVTASTLPWRALAGRARQLLVSRPTPRSRRARSVASRREAANDDDDAATMRAA